MGPRAAFFCIPSGMWLLSLTWVPWSRHDGVCLADFERWVGFMPSVSVVMPVYNAERWLPRSLDGVLSQTLGDLELIAVDDASTDGSLAVLERWATRDPRVRVLHHEKNLFAGAARNDGLAAARGEYVLFLDSDDEFEPTLLEEAVGEACRSGADVVLMGADDLVGGAEARTSNPRYLDVALLPERLPFAPADAAGHLFQLCTPEPWTKLFKRSFVEAEGLRFQGLQNANDLFFTLAALSRTHLVSAAPEALVHHRVGVAGGVQATKAREPLAFLEALRALKADLEGRGLFALYERSFVNLVVFHCIYNAAAPANWPAVFTELGVAGHLREEFHSVADYGRYIDLVVDAWDGSVDPALYGDAFWRDAALRGAERAREMQAEVGWANEELARVKGSVPLRLGMALTWLPRKVRGWLGERG